MLYWLLYPLKEHISVFNVFGYITVRTALAGITALLICLLLGPFVIRILKKYQIGEEIRSDGPKSHFEKKGTPSMGGILIIGSTILPTLLWGNLSNIYVLLAMGTMLWAISSSQSRQMEVPITKRVRRGGCQSYFRNNL